MMKKHEASTLITLYKKSALSTIWLRTILVGSCILVACFALGLTTITPRLTLAAAVVGSGESTEDEAAETPESQPEESPESAPEDQPEEEAVEEDPAEEETEQEAEPEGDENDDDAEEGEDDADIAYEKESDTDILRAGDEKTLAYFAVLDDDRTKIKNIRRFKKLGLTSELVPLTIDETRILGSWEAEMIKAAPGTAPNDSAPTGQPKLPAAPIPQYTAGDTFVYSDGSWERVISYSEMEVKWRNHRGNPSSGSPDFTYRRSGWQTSKRRGARSFKHTSFLFEKPTTSLWPLQTGKTTRFDEFGRWAGFEDVEHVYDAYWRCSVEGTETVTVAAGEFDTWRIMCARYADSFSYSRSAAREYRIWNYAPAVQHWVLEIRENLGNRPDSRRELVAILPDLSLFAGTARTASQIQQQFQEVLEGYGQGQNDLWLASAGDIAVNMTPHAVFKRDDGRVCRQYSQQVEAPGLEKVYPGVACRSSKGGWRIPRK